MRRTLGGLRYANVMATIAVFVALGGGAWAVGVQGGGGTTTLRACAAKNGTLRLLTARQRCRRGERAVTWNVRGPAGAPGAAGPAGAPGAPGSAGAVGATGSAGSAAQFTGAAAGGALTGVYPAPALAAGAVTTGGLAAAAVTGAKIAPATITGANVASNTLTGATIDESTLTGVAGVGTSAVLQVSPLSGTLPLLTAAGIGRVQITCTDSGAGTFGANLAYTNLSGGTQYVSTAGQAQGGTQTLTGASLANNATTAAANAANSATQDRVLRVVYSAGTDTAPGSTTVFVAEVFTNWLGGGNCLARAHVHRAG